ncbi:MAG: hypothetical protein Q8N16_01090 [bacterium]|nr:hypothetical protein [bacterium]
MGKTFIPSKNIGLFFGIKKAIALRIGNWEETEKESLVIVAPETTPKKRIKTAESKRGKFLKKDKVTVKFIENISNKASLEKNLKRLEQGIEVRHFPHHGFSVSVRDRKTVLLEFPMPKNELLNILIKDRDFAKMTAAYFNNIWKKSQPLDKKLIEKLRWKFRR